MANLYKDKKIILVCLLLILGVVGLVYLNDYSKIKNSEGILENREEEIKRYEANQIIPVYMEEYDMVEKYLNDYKNLLLTDVNEAYSLLNEEYRNLKYSNIDDFYSYVNSIKSVALYQLTVDKYSVRIIDGKKFFDIYGTDGNRYIIKEISIMNYEVFLDTYTLEIK